VLEDVALRLELGSALDLDRELLIESAIAFLTVADSLPSRRIFIVGCRESSLASIVASSVSLRSATTKVSRRLMALLSA
jgi:hypothetical protein